MKKTISFLILLLCSVIAMADNEISLNTTSGMPGDVVTVVTSFATDEANVAAEFVFPLGGNLHYQAGTAVLAADRSNGHSLYAQEVNDTLYISIFSMSLSALRGTEGELLRFDLKLGSEPVSYSLNPIVQMGDPDGNPITTTVSAGLVTIISPKIEISTPTIDFGHQPIRQTYTRTLTLRNVGTAPLTVSSLQMPSDEFSYDGQPRTLAAGASENITITYKPLIRGAFSGKIIVSSDAVNAALFAGKEVSIVADPFSVNELHLGNASGKSDSTVTVSVTVNNMEPLVGTQFSINLPSQLEYVAGSATLSARAASHSVMDVYESGKLTIMTYSISGDTLTGNDGELLTFKLRLLGQTGTYSINPTEVMLGNATLENMTSATSGGYVSISSPRYSSNSSLAFPRTPITENAQVSLNISNYGGEPLTINEVKFLGGEAYNVVTDLPLTIAAGGTSTLTVEHVPAQEGNFTGTMQIYTNDPSNRLYSVSLSGSVYEPNTITMEGELTDEGYLLHISMDNYTEMAGFQFDVVWLDSMQAVFTPSARLSGLTSMMMPLGEGSYRLMAFALSGKKIAGNDGELCTILFSGQQPTYYNNTTIFLDSIYLSDAASSQRLSVKTTDWLVSLRYRLTLSAENGTVLVSDSTPASAGHDQTRVTPLPSVPFEFNYKASDYDATTASIPNHPDAILADYKMQLSSNLPAFQDSCLDITSICRGYINRWSQESSESGSYFYRSGSDNMTIVFKVAPMLNSGNASDFISNRGGNYNYMLRVGDNNTMFLHTGSSYSSERSLPLNSSEPQTMAVRVNSADNYILLQNLTTGESKQISGVNWGGSGTAFKFFYNDGGEYFRGKFFWAYYSTSLLTDDQVAAVAAFNNNSKSAVAPSTPEEGYYDYGSELWLSAEPDEDYEFAQWSDGSTDNPRKIVMTQDVELSAQFEVAVTPGDADLNGIVDVNDITVTATYIRGGNPDPFSFKNADVDGNEDIDVNDIVGIAVIIRDAVE